MQLLCILAVNYKIIIIKSAISVNNALKIKQKNTKFKITILLAIAAP